MKKNPFLLSTICLAGIFLGCGGDSQTSNRASIISDSEGNFIVKQELNGKVKIDPLSGNFSDEFKNFVSADQPINIDLTNYQAVENALSQLQLIKLRLEYNSISKHIQYVKIHANNKMIGENFIVSDPKQHLEGFMRALNIQDELKGHAVYINFTPNLFSIHQNQVTIHESLKNNSSRNEDHTVDLTIQKTDTNNYAVSNIKVSDIKSVRDSFVLRNNQYTTTDLKKFQLMLATLFVNFRKSQEIF